MTNNIWLVYWYTILLGLVAQAILLVLQWRTYRNTGHTSLRTIAISTVLGIVYIGLSYAAVKCSMERHNPLMFYVSAAIVLTLQMAIGIAGIRSLFRAFEQMFTNQRGGA